MKTTLTIALILVALFAIVGLGSLGMILPFWTWPAVALCGGLFGRSVAEMLEAIWRL